MNRAGRETLSHLRRADDRSPIVEDPDQVVFLDPSFFGILRVNPNDPVVVTVLFQDPVILDLVDQLSLASPMV